MYILGKYCAKISFSLWKLALTDWPKLQGCPRQGPEKDKVFKEDARSREPPKGDLGPVNNGTEITAA